MRRGQGAAAVAKEIALHASIVESRGIGLFIVGTLPTREKLIPIRDFDFAVLQLRTQRGQTRRRLAERMDLQFREAIHARESIRLCLRDIRFVQVEFTQRLESRQTGESFTSDWGVKKRQRFQVR